MREKIDERIPRATALLMPVFVALRELGDSGKNEEILQQIIKDLNIPDEIADIQHKGKPGKTELSYQTDWARTYLKMYGIIENSSRGVWTILPDYVSKEEEEVEKVVNEARKKAAVTGVTPKPTVVPPETEPWRELLESVLQNMNPYGFERLAQRLLRECGFTQVEVTKKSGDGGIDGFGKLKINGIFSFNVAFQCKRYKGIVGSAEIRDFRGSLTADIEKGVMITTGSFSKAAMEEATNHGKQQIDLVDGEEFINMLVEYGIGVKPVTTYEVDVEFFNQI